jgi:hypothetical protein
VRGVDADAMAALDQDRLGVVVIQLIPAKSAVLDNSLAEAGFALYFRTAGSGSYLRIFKDLRTVVASS